MATDYCTHMELVNFLQLPLSSGDARQQLTAATMPLQEEVEGWINEIEDYIDRKCNHSWRSITVTEETHHNVAFQKTSYYSWRGAVVVHLYHREITTLSSPTDKVEIFQGNSWYDLLANETEGTGYGEGAFYIDKQRGIIYVYGRFPTRGKSTIRVTYRYGEVTVPKTIRRATLLLTSIQFLRSDDYVRLFPDGSNAYAIESKAQSMQEEADRILSMYQEFITI